MAIIPDTPLSNGATTKAESWFGAAEYVPPDAIFALTAQYLKDPSPLKVNLGQGTYRDNDGKPWVLPSVRQAREQLLTQGLDHEYLPILGLHDFRERAAETALGSAVYADREKVSFDGYQRYNARVLVSNGRDIACNLSESFWYRCFASRGIITQDMSKISPESLHTRAYMVQSSPGVQIVGLPLRVFPLL